MIAVNREHVNKVAEMLAVLHTSMTDSNGHVLAFPVELNRYPAAIMAALVALSGGEAIAYQGDTHINVERSEFIHMQNPKPNSFRDELFK